MAESIDPKAVSSGEPRNEPAEQAGLPKSLWESDLEIPRRLGNAPAPTSWYGWLAIAVALGSACVVLAAGDIIIAWRQPSSQNATEPQFAPTAVPAGNHLASAVLPDEKPRGEVAQVPPLVDGDAQPRQLAVAPSTGPASESQSSTSELAPTQSQPPGDDNRPSIFGPRPAEASATRIAPSAYRLAINRVRAALVAGDLKRAQQ